MGGDDGAMTRLQLLLLAFATAIALCAPATASADFGFLGDFGKFGDGNGQFHDPTYLDVAPDGSVWVGEHESRVQKFTPDGQFLTQVKIGVADAGQVATDGAGNLYVVNTGTNQIQKFDANGNPLGAFGGFGDQPGQFQGICGLTADGAGNFYVSDGRGGYCDTTPRIQKFDPNGNLVKEIKLTAKTDPHGVGDLAVDAAGNIFAADNTHFGKSEIFKLSPDGVLLSRFGSRGGGPAQFGDGGPESIAVAPDGTIYAVDAVNHRIQHLSADGSFINQFGAANALNSVAVAPSGDVYVTRGRQSVPVNEDADDLSVERVMRFGQNAPAAPPSPLTLSPSVKITVGAALAKKCGIKPPYSSKPITDCTGMREATIEWRAGCPADGPLTRRSVEISVGSYDPAQPAIIPAVTDSHSDTGSTKIVLWAGSKVTPKISVNCVAYTQPDGEPVSAKGSATGNTITTAPVARTGYMEYSRSARGVLLGNFRGKKVKGAIKHGKEVRLFWGAAHDESLRKGYVSVKVHLRGAGIKVDDYFHSYHREDYGPRLLIKPRKPGVLQVWVTVNGVRSLNTVKLRVV
jgi:DNA-binding beta-propeller fold protein YncE